MASPASLDALRRRAAVCTACDLYKRATQTVLGPDAVVCLGVTAATAVLKRRVTIGGSRGQALVSPEGIATFVTVHPSAILRIPGRLARETEMRRLAQDLSRAAEQTTR
jgi:DNA polymerase